MFCLAQVVFGAAEGVFRPAARSIMPEVVPEQSLEKANGYATMAFQAGFLVGPLTAGAFIALKMLVLGPVLVAVFGLGGLVGGVVAARIRTIRPVYWILVGLIVVACQPIFLASGLSIVAVAFLQFLAGVGLAVYSVVQESAEQRLIPRAALARVSSIDLFATTGAMPIGFVLCGELAEIAGLSASMWVMVAIAICGCDLAFVVWRSGTPESR